MFDKAVNTHPSTTQFIPECYKIKQICNKTVDVDVLLFLILFSINTTLKKYVTEFFLRIFF